MPTETNTASAPPPNFLFTDFHGLLFVAKTPSVAPNSIAIFSFSSERSTATILRAPARRAPWIALSPTPPAPITTTSWPGFIFAAFTTAPIPVITPHAISAAVSYEIVLFTLTTCDLSTTTFSANAPHAIACINLSPFKVFKGPLVPSYSVRQSVGCPCLQFMQSPQDRISVTTTLSPIDRPLMLSPMQLTSPEASCP